jgi:hypothetical protein
VKWAGLAAGITSALDDRSRGIPRS